MSFFMFLLLLSLLSWMRLVSFVAFVLFSVEEERQMDEYHGQQQQRDDRQHGGEKCSGVQDVMTTPQHMREG
jgi:hypothetical protein